MFGPSAFASRWQATRGTSRCSTWQSRAKLRGCDLVGLRVRDVFAAGRVKERTSMIHSKTGKPVRFEITETARLSLERWIKDPEMAGLEFL
jgi:hypothetical protein